MYDCSINKQLESEDLICVPSKIYKQYNKGDILSKARTFSTTKDWTVLDGINPQ